MKHEHRWGTWFYVGRRRYRVCINGWCPMGQHANGHEYVARPDRRVRALRERGKAK